MACKLVIESFAPPLKLVAVQIDSPMASPAAAEGFPTLANGPVPSVGDAVGGLPSALAAGSAAGAGTDDSASASASASAYNSAERTPSAANTAGDLPEVRWVRA